MKKKYLEVKENENIMFQNQQDAAKKVPRGWFIVIQAYFRKQEKQSDHTPKETRKKNKA